jgi:hypothetical protein
MAESVLHFQGFNGFDKPYGTATVDPAKIIAVTPVLFNYGFMGMRERTLTRLVLEGGANVTVFDSPEEVRRVLGWQ